MKQNQLKEFFQMIMKIMKLNELHRLKRYENKVIKDNLFYESSKHIYDFKMFKTIRSFGDSIYNQKIEIISSDVEMNKVLANNPSNFF